MSEKKRRFPFPELPDPLELLGSENPLEDFADVVSTINSFAEKLDGLAGKVEHSLGTVPRLETARLKPIEVEPGLAEDMRRGLDRVKAQAEEALNLSRDGKLSEAARLLTQAAEKTDCPGCDTVIYKAALKLKLAEYERALKEERWRSTLDDAQRDLRDLVSRLPRIKGAILERR